MKLPIFKSLKIILVLAFFGLVSLSFVKPSFASTLGFTSSTGAKYVDDTFNVPIVLDTQGESINAVSAIISYPEDMLEVVSIIPSGQFPVEAENIAVNGTIRVSRGSYDGVTGTIQLAFIEFRVRKAGIATLSFTNESAVVRAAEGTDSLSQSTPAVINTLVKPMFGFPFGSLAQALVKTSL